MRTLTLCFGLCAVAAPFLPLESPETATSASVASMPLDELVRRSDVIALVHVTKVEAIVRREEERLKREPTDAFSFLDEWRAGSEVHFAEAEIVRLLKGDVALTRVHFLAEGTWTCDISDAELNENALLFLEDFHWVEQEGPGFRAAVAAFADGGGLSQIMFSGRGRLPLRKIGEDDYATYWKDVVMPKDLVNIDGPEPEYAGFIRSARVRDLEQLIRADVASQGAMLRAQSWIPGKPVEEWSVAIWRDKQCAWNFAVGGHELSKTKRYDDSIWVALDQDHFRAWPDAPATSGGAERFFSLDVLANGHRRRIRLPEPSSLRAPLDPALEEASRAWLALLDAAESPDAKDARERIRSLLSLAR